MNFAKIMAAVTFVIISAMTSYGDEPATGKAGASDAGAITAVVKSYVTKETVESVYVDKIVGDYAAVIVSVKDGDGGMACLKKTGGNWSVIFYGNALSEAALVELGVPADIAKKVVE